MADEYINREALIKERHTCKRDCTTCDFAIDGDSWCEGELFVVDVLRAPAADVVEVVRCGECANTFRSEAPALWCVGRGWPMQMVPLDGFCDKGKRKEEENEN